LLFEKNMENKELTYGQRMVGVSFNPSGNALVDAVKQGYANVIDDMANLREQTDDQEKKRLCSIAITEAQSAQMWAVKAITWK